MSDSEKINLSAFSSYVKTRLQGDELENVLDLKKLYNKISSGNRKLTAEDKNLISRFGLADAGYLAEIENGGSLNDLKLSILRVPILAKVLAAI